MAEDDDDSKVEHMLVHRLRRDFQTLRAGKVPKGQADFDKKKARLQPDFAYFCANGARVVAACQSAQAIGTRHEPVVDIDTLMTKHGRLSLSLESLCDKVEAIARDPASEPSVIEQCRAALSLLALIEDLQWHFFD